MFHASILNGSDLECIKRKATQGTNLRILNGERGFLNFLSRKRLQ